MAPEHFNKHGLGSTRTGWNLLAGAWSARACPMHCVHRKPEAQGRGQAGQYPCVVWLEILMNRLWMNFQIGCVAPCCATPLNFKSSLKEVLKFEQVRCFAFAPAGPKAKPGNGLFTTPAKPLKVRWMGMNWGWNMMKWEVSEVFSDQLGDQKVLRGPGICSYRISNAKPGQATRIVASGILPTYRQSLRLAMRLGVLPGEQQREVDAQGGESKRHQKRPEKTVANRVKRLNCCETLPHCACCILYVIFLLIL